MFVLCNVMLLLFEGVYIYLYILYQLYIHFSIQYYYYYDVCVVWQCVNVIVDAVMWWRCE